MRITIWDPSRKVNHLSKVARLISSTRIGKPVVMVDVKCPKTKTLADGLIERTSSMLDEIESKSMHKAEEGER